MLHGGASLRVQLMPHGGASERVQVNNLWNKKTVTFKVQKTELFFTMSHPRADLLWQMPHHGEGEVKKCPTNARGMGALGID